jgi:hypothetical protein
MQNGLCHRRGAYTTAFEKVPRACRRALVVLEHYSWTKRAIYMLARLERRRCPYLAPDSVRSSTLACWPAIDGLATSRAVKRRALAGRAGVLRQGSRRNEALTRFELLRMDGDETTSVERQYGRMQGVRVSHRRVMLSARAPGGVAGAEPRGAIVPSRSVCCDRARVLRLRCAGVYSVHDSSYDDDEHGRGVF